MTNIDYSLWPNADDNLGEIKVQIPDGVTTLWPAGDALVGNFVYNEGKLAGFVDTKALILNESAITTFPYDYVDISLPSIQEGTLTINRSERCKYLNVKMYRADWLPAGFTELEYLESSGTQYIFFETDKTWEKSWGYKAVGTLFSPSATSQLFFSCSGSGNGDISAGYYPYSTPETIRVGGFLSKLSVEFENGRKYDCEVNFFNSGENRINEEKKVWTPSSSLFYPLKGVVLMGWCWDTQINPSPSPGAGQIRLFSFAITIGNDFYYNMVPVLDASGIPCIYDKVSGQCFYNQGTGTFGYRIKTTDNSVAPLSLRDPYYVAPSGVYAKLIAENELEIAADTEEVQGDDWVHFANTGEAYEHFGITFEDETLV